MFARGLGPRFWGSSFSLKARPVFSGSPKAPNPKQLTLEALKLNPAVCSIPKPILWPGLIFRDMLISENLDKEEAGG